MQFNVLNPLQMLTGCYPKRQITHTMPQHSYLGDTKYRHLHLNGAECQGFNVWGHSGTDQYHVRLCRVHRITPTCEITV